LNALHLAEQHPMMQIGQTYHEHLTCEKVDEVIDHYKNNTEGTISHWSKDKIKA
jgi:hypothetical protein